MESVIKKIKEFRTEKGYSHEYMAHQLNMSQPAYSKIEKNETSLSVDKLYKIAEILETPVEKFLEIPVKNYKQDIHNNENVTAVAHQEVENLHQNNKELQEKLILTLETEIVFLKELLHKNLK